MSSESGTIRQVKGAGARARSQEIVSAPIRPLLTRLTASAVMGALAIHTLGIVDTWFISRLGTVPLAAASFVIPVNTVYLSFAFGIGMAISSLNSRLSGEGRFDDSARLITDGLLFAVLFAVLAALVGWLFMGPLFQLLGAEPETRPYIHEYMSILLLALPLLMLIIICNATYRSTGNVKVSAMLSVLLAVLNMIFDPFLIFGLGPFPALGIQGAAWASLAAATTTLSISLFLLGRHEQLLDFSRPVFSLLRENWRKVLSIAVPAMGANTMTPLAAAIMTAMLARFGDEVVAGFGVGSRIEMLSLIVAMGLSATLPMFIGQNVGAGKGERAYTALLGSLKFIIAFQLLIYLLLLFSVDSIAAAFSDNERVQEVIRLFLFVLPLSYGAHAVVILAMVSLNVLRHPRTALFLTVLRLLLLYLPLAYIGGRLWGIQGFFIGAACGNLLAACGAFVIIRRVCRQQGLLPTPTAGLS